MSEGAGSELIEAWPGLKVEEGQINIRLFRTAPAAREASLGGVRASIEHALQKDFAWLQKDLRALARFGPQVAGWCSLEELQASAFIHLQRRLLPKHPLPSSARSISAPRWTRLVEGFRAGHPSSWTVCRKYSQSGRTFSKRVQPVPGAKPARTLMSFQQLETTRAKPVLVSPVEQELNTLMPKTFLQVCHWIGWGISCGI